MPYHEKCVPKPTWQERMCKNLVLKSCSTADLLLLLGTGVQPQRCNDVGKKHAGDHTTCHQTHLCGDVSHTVQDGTPHLACLPPSIVALCVQLRAPHQQEGHCKAREIKGRLVGHADAASKKCAWGIAGCETPNNKGRRKQQNRSCFAGQSPVTPDPRLEPKPLLRRSSANPCHKLSKQLLPQQPLNTCYHEAPLLCSQRCYVTKASAQCLSS
eukprot:1159099-Pelagomonas_calceolata.AAC.4